MSTQPQSHRRNDDTADTPDATPVAPVVQQHDAARDAELDSLLDEIDGVLEKDATEFVHGFVQKGGQ